MRLLTIGVNEKAYWTKILITWTHSTTYSNGYNQWATDTGFGGIYGGIYAINGPAAGFSNDGSGAGSGRYAAFWNKLMADAKIVLASGGESALRDWGYDNYGRFGYTEGGGEIDVTGTGYNDMTVSSKFVLTPEALGSEKQGAVILDVNGNVLRSDRGANMIYVDMGNGSMEIFRDRLVRNGKMTTKGFSNGLLSIVNGMRLPKGNKFDRNKLHNGDISLAILGNDGKIIKYNDGIYYGQANELTNDGYFKITYSHINGQSLTVDLISSIIGIHEYYAHGILGLTHPGDNAEIDNLVNNYLSKP